MCGEKSDTFTSFGFDAFLTSFAQSFALIRQAAQPFNQNQSTGCFKMIDWLVGCQVKSPPIQGQYDLCSHSEKAN